MKIFVFFLLLSSWSSLYAKPYLEYRSGKRVRSLILHFNNVYNFQKEIYSDKIELQLKGSVRDGHIKGEAFQCQIGGVSLAPSQVKVMIDGVEILPINRIKEFFNVQLKVINPNKLAGEVSCAHLALNFLE